jgi:hypothetical protein
MPQVIPAVTGAAHRRSADRHGRYFDHSDNILRLVVGSADDERFNSDIPLAALTIRGADRVLGHVRH